MCLNAYYEVTPQDVGGCKLSIAGNSASAGLTAYHAFVVFEDATGIYQYHGRPSGNVSGSYSNVNDPIRVEVDMGTPQAPIELLLAAGPDICEVKICLEFIRNEFNTNDYQYFFWAGFPIISTKDVNSNTVARTFLETCEMPVRLPDGFPYVFPGWEIDLGLNYP